jgi:hypothetical protein
MEAHEMGLTGMGFSTVAIAAGAIMYWAVTYQGHGFRFSMGVILMVVGAIGLLISSRRPAGGRRHAYDKQTIDSEGRSTGVHEAVK